MKSISRMSSVPVLDEDVVRLDAAVDNAGFVDFFQGRGQPAGDGEEIRQRHPIMQFHEPVEGYSGEVVLGDEGGLVFVAEGNGRDHQGIIQYPQVLDPLAELGSLVFGQAIRLQGLENQEPLRIVFVTGFENHCLRRFG